MSINTESSSFYWEKMFKVCAIYLGTVIYLLESIYFLRLTVWSDIFNFWSGRSRIWSDIYFCLEFFPSYRMTGVFSVWSDNFSFWSDICPMSNRHFKAWALNISCVSRTIVLDILNVFWQDRAYYGSSSQN